MPFAQKHVWKEGKMMVIVSDAKVVEFYKTHTFFNTFILILSDILDYIANA